MVRLTKIYTRGGDTGQTSLVSGARVAKTAPRLAAIGAVDELNAALGLARSHTDGDSDAMLARVQNDLFDLGADLASPEATPNALRITADQVSRLETEIDRMNESLAPLESFILPGGYPAAAHLHFARTVARRAEREVAALGEAEAINAEALRYINRLSDHLFVMARSLNDSGQADVLWVPGGRGRNEENPGEASN